MSRVWQGMTVLAETVSRNIFGALATSAPAAGAMAACIRTAVKGLRRQAANALIAGHIPFEARLSSTGADSQLSEVSR